MQFRPARPTVTFRIANFATNQWRSAFISISWTAAYQALLKFKLKLDCDVTRDGLITWSSQSSFPPLLAKKMIMFSCTREREPNWHELCKTRYYLSKIMNEHLPPCEGLSNSPTHNARTTLGRARKHLNKLECLM